MQLFGCEISRFMTMWTAVVLIIVLFARPRTEKQLDVAFVSPNY